MLARARGCFFLKWLDVSLLIHFSTRFVTKLSAGARPTPPPPPPPPLWCVQEKTRWRHKTDSAKKRNGDARRISRRCSAQEERVRRRRRRVRVRVSGVSGDLRQSRHNAVRPYVSSERLPASSVRLFRPSTTRRLLLLARRYYDVWERWTKKGASWWMFWGRLQPRQFRSIRNFTFVDALRRRTLTLLSEKIWQLETPDRLIGFSFVYIKNERALWGL